MIENEMKFNLGGICAFQNLLSAFTEMASKKESPFLYTAEIFQINYYYDTPSFYYHECGTTLRVRQTCSYIETMLSDDFTPNEQPKEGLEVQIKKHERGSEQSQEQHEEIDELPGALFYNNERVPLLGNLTTRRYSFALDGLRFDLDANYYLGNTDYEIEIEYSEDHRAEAQYFAQTLGLADQKRNKGKMTRFAEAYRAMR